MTAMVADVVMDETLSEFAKKIDSKSTNRPMQENTENVIDMISGQISPSRLKTTKSIFYDGQYLHKMLGVNNNLFLPNEIGTIFFPYTCVLVILKLMLLFLL
jgi:hypothetical protein